MYKYLFMKSTILFTITIFINKSPVNELDGNTTQSSRSSLFCVGDKICAENTLKSGPSSLFTLSNIGNKTGTPPTPFITSCMKCKQ